MAVALEDLSEEELDQVGLTIGEPVSLEFESGVKVTGTVLSKTIRESHLILLSLIHCQVTYESQILFEPGWGTYDMAIGKNIVSAFSGPADPEAFGLSYPAPEEKTHKLAHTEEAKQLHALYQQVRDIREQNCSHALIPSIWDSYKTHHQSLEILEILKDKKISDALTVEVTAFLRKKQADNPELVKLINDGFAMLEP
jgi:phenylalanine-4-hydroxylase